MMPVYACYRGDCEHLAFAESAETFKLRDALGQSWLCVETPLADLSEGIPEIVPEMLRLQQQARQDGTSRFGTTVNYFDCPDRGCLARELRMNTLPTARESASRLSDRGWEIEQKSWGTGRPFRLTVGSDWVSLTVDGDSENEVWFRAAEIVLGANLDALKGNPAMTLNIQAEPLPLRPDLGDTLRIGKTRVTLDTLIECSKLNMTPKEIVEAYPTLRLADVYTVIGWYLQNQEVVDAYLEQRREEAEALRQKIEATPGRKKLTREELLARQAALEQGHASSGK